MPRHETIEANLLDIFSRHKKFFDDLAQAVEMDVYKNAFIGLHDKGFDLKHLEECFESLRQASQEANFHLTKYYPQPANVSDQRIEVDTFIGGESELRVALNNRMSPKTVARATLYNYLEDLGIRKAVYTSKDLDKVLEHIKSLKTTRKKS
jgi:hypothetical protein